MQISRAQTPAQLLTAALTQDPARPLVTFYDDATGERVELSVATFDNWVAKTANLLQDELGAEPGDEVALLLPTHWQTAVWMHACWALGTVAVLDESRVPDATVVVSGPERREQAEECAGERVAAALRPLGAGLPEPVPGFLDYAEVSGQPDHFVAYAPVGQDATALHVRTPDESATMDATAENDTAAGDAETAHRLSHAELLRQAGERAQSLGLSAGARVLSSRALDTFHGLLDGLLAPLSVGGSVVLCRNLDELTGEQLAAREAAERVTHTLR